MTCTHPIARSALVAVVFAIVLQLPARTPVLAQTPTNLGKATRSQIAASYANLPLRFEANQGQADDTRVRFLARGNGYELHLTLTAAVLILAHPRQAANNSPAVVRMTLVGASANPDIIGRETLPGKSHYYMGSDPTKWRTNIPNYAKVAYQEVYPGVNLVYYGNQRQLEYDFVVASGADPTVIRLAFDGVDRLVIDALGDLVLHTAGGELRQDKPLVYQDVDGVRREIASGYVVEDQEHVSFWLGDYDARRPLIIDPVLSYSTYLGTEQHDLVVAVAESSSFYGQPTGVVYVSGTDGIDAFVTALDLNQAGTGMELHYSTRFGGGATEIANAIAVDRFGFAYVTGTTASNDFVTKKAHQRDFQGALDAFVTVLDPMGGLLYSTYLGGGADDLGNAIAVDQDCEFPNCQVYVAGNTASAAFPVANPLQGTYNGGSSDAFVSKLDFQMLDTGNVLTYSTYFGGPGMDIGNDIAVDAQCISNCDVYITGSTDSQVFPIANAWQALFGGGPSDAFVAKLNADGSLAYSTYVGAQGADSGRGIAVDGGVPGFGNAFVTGWSDDAGSIPGVLFLGASGSSIDAFVVKLDATGGWVYGTSFGGSGEDRGSAIALEPDCQFDCDAYVAGVTRPRIGVPPDFPTVHPVQPAFGGGASDAFVVRVNGAGTDLIYSTYLGGSGDELNLGDAFSVGPSIAVDIDGNAYIAGFTLSTDFPTVNPLKPFNAGSNDAFVAKLDASGPPVADAGPDQEVPATSNMDADVTLDGTGSTDPDGDPLAYSWTGPFGGALHGATPNLSFAPGTYTLTLTVHDGRDGTDTDTVVITVTEAPNAEPVADAGPEQTVTCTVQQGDAEECLVQLDGSGSFDPDGDPLTYEWLLLGATSTEAALMVSLPAGGPHTINLRVEDDRGGTAFDYVVVSVIVNHAPVADPQLLELVIPCIGPDGENVKFNALARISDMAVVPYRQDQAPRLDFWGSDIRNHTTEGDTLWVNYTTSHFRSRSTVS